MTGRFVLNRSGVSILLRKDPGLEKMISEAAEKVAQTAGGEDVGFEAGHAVGRRRMRSWVNTTTLHAERAERADRRLTRAVDAARGDRHG